MAASDPAIAYFISPHGFGHAARACAVIEALASASGGLRVEIFTTAPAWFFADSLEVEHTVHPVLTDVGLVQRTALVEDLPATIERLAHLLPARRPHVMRLARQVLGLDCRALLADISPLGLAVGERAGIPAVLIENFTWDWLYEPYVQQEPRFAEYIEIIGGLVRKASLHVQAEPVCRRNPRAMQVRPIARRPRQGREAIRARLGVRDDEALVLVTMGGVAWEGEGIEAFAGSPHRFVVLADGEGAAPAPSNVLLLCRRSGWYHPDLVQAADVVVGKLGYSTVAEAVAAGTRYAYVERPDFAETVVLEAHVGERVPAVRLAVEEFRSGQWVERLPALLGQPRASRARADGADQIAGALGHLLVR